MIKAFKKKAKHAWRAAPIATVILAIALTASLFFGVRTFAFWYNRPPLMDRAQPVAAWMTPRYVVRAWGVPPDVVRDALGQPEAGSKGMTSLAQIAEERGISIEELLAEVQAAIVSFRETRDPPQDGPADD